MQVTNDNKTLLKVSYAYLGYVFVQKCDIIII